MAKDPKPEKERWEKAKRVENNHGVPPERETQECHFWVKCPNQIGNLSETLTLKDYYCHHRNIYRNLRNAILQQGAGILDESGAYATKSTRYDSIHLL